MSGEIAPIPDSQSAFGDRFKVITAKPLPEFSTHGGDAYEVEDGGKSGGDYYALVHNVTVPVRNEVYKLLRNKPIPNMICPSERGLVNLELGGKKVQRLVTVFPRPTGGALMSETGAVHPRVNANMLRHSVTLSLLKAITALHKKGFTHRSIMPTNIYFASASSDEVVIGECYSMPAGFKQPFAMDALDIAMADAVARGQGDAASDYYQMGAAIQAFYLGDATWRGRDRNAMLMARVNQGSYGALSAGREIPGALGSLCMGLMADVVEERWGAEEVLDWFEGVGKPKRMTMRGWSMSRPTSFNGIAMVDRRLLADAFARDPKEATIFLKSMDFKSWIGLSFKDEVLSDRLASLIGVKEGGGLGGMRPEDYKMVARVCMFLHPVGPVRFKGYSFYLDGVPALVADAYARDDRELLSAVVEVLDQRFLSALSDIAAAAGVELESKIGPLRKVMDVANNKQMGKGTERVLYELNPMLPCLSTRFQNVWIGSLLQMMRAIERIATHGSIKNILQDRHIAAFCTTHGSDLDRDFVNLTTAQHNPAKFNSLTLDFFGLLQRRGNMEALPNLTAKLVEGLAPAVKELKNKKRRERIQALLEKHQKSGDIGKLMTDVNMVRAQAEDSREFSQARTQIMRLERERLKLSKKILPNDPEARVKGMNGSRWAAFVGMSIVIALSFL